MPFAGTGLVIDPLKGELATSIVRRPSGSSPAKTHIIPEEILGPLVRASLQYVDQFAEYLLDASGKMERIRNGKPLADTQYFRKRCLRQHTPSASQLAGTRFEKGLHSLEQFNRERLGKENGRPAPLPRGPSGQNSVEVA
jgi:hypothetical protein